MRHETHRTARRRRWLTLTLVAVSAAALGGCCCTKADHDVAIVDIDGDRWDGSNWVLVQPPYSGFPDDSIRLHVEAGQTVCFVNATEKTCTVEASTGTYEEGHVFTIKPHSCEKRTIADLAVGTKWNNTVKCSGLDHGAPGMIVVDHSHSDS